MQAHSREQARGFAGQEIAGSVVARDQAARWDGALFRRMGAVGLLGALFPRAYGGGEATASALCEAMIGFGAGSGDAGLALAWGAHTLGCGVPLWRLGSEAQRRRYLPGICTGEVIGGWAHDEWHVAGDPIGVQTRARRCAGGWVLEGSKTWVVNAPIADLFIVTAVTDPSRGAAGLSSFVVERETPGLTIGPRLATAGARTAAISGLALERCELPADSLLGPEGGGLARTWRLVQRWERGCMLAPWLGLLSAGLERSVAHLRAGIHLGAPLAGSQCLRARLADLRIHLELCERLLARSAWQLEHPERGAERELALARLFIGERLPALSGEAASLCGAQALELGHALERLVRDAPLAGLLGVRGEVLRSIIAGDLLDLG